MSLVLHNPLLPTPYQLRLYLHYGRGTPDPSARAEVFRGWSAYPTVDGVTQLNCKKRTHIKHQNTVTLTLTLTLTLNHALNSFSQKHFQSPPSPDERSQDHSPGTPCASQSIRFVSCDQRSGMRLTCRGGTASSCVALQAGIQCHMRSAPWAKPPSKPLDDTCHRRLHDGGEVCARILPRR